MKNLPVGIQSFEDLRTSPQNYLYVDKTEHIYRLITTGKLYFLSRPRRFGKSLLINTFGELFKGNKNLFEGLYIHDKWDWNTKYPVIRIDWSDIKHGTPEEIEKDLSDFLKLKAKDYDITLTREYASSRLAELIEYLHRKTGEKVVVLIDEYDVPILDAMGKSSEELKNIKDSLHNIYKILKSADNHLRFIFMTGVSKFAGLSVFSALNNLDDISLWTDYSTICGITQAELESNFSEHIDAMAAHQGKSRSKLLEDIRLHYNGYSWDGRTSVYNPYSTLLCLKHRRLENFWFSTGTPTFLIELLKKRNSVINAFLNPATVLSHTFNSYDSEELEETPLLFQTGYLTIKEATHSDEGTRYTLGIPNREVKV
ncbi:MAG: AAA family ATPase, partial [Dysgonamonadaceae bacterium]|nr:AAA family ATPase [Dysgonamonadaceae bacterium]